MDEFGSFYKDIKNRKYNTWCRYKKRLDTYGRGCAHECKYCYAKSLLEFRGNWNAEKPAIANMDEINNRLYLLRRGDVLRLGSMTDCFQPIEEKQNITYETIKLLNDHGIHYLIVTKSDMVSSDRYMEIYDKKLAHFQISITTTCDQKSIEFENAPVSSLRIRAIEKLAYLGYDVSVRLSPFLFQYIDYEVLNNIQCDKILVEFLKVNHWTRKRFFIDYSEYTEKYGGHENLPLDRKIELVDKIKGFNQISVGEYVKEHYEYFRDNVNYNKEDCCNLDIEPPIPDPEQMSFL